MSRVWEQVQTAGEVRNPGALGLEELLEQARPRVWKWLAQRIPDPETVADLTQEVLAKLWENRRKWDPKRGFGGWLLRIMTNHYFDWRRRRPQDLLAQSYPWEEPPEDPGGSSREASPEEQVLQTELHQQVDAALRALPPKYRDILCLFYMEEWKCRDIADSLNLTVTQVEGRLFRGRTMLRSALQPFSEA